MNARVLLIVVAALAIAICASRASARTDAGTGSAVSGSVQANASAVRAILRRNEALNRLYRLGAFAPKWAVFSLDGKIVGISTEPGSRSVRLQNAR